MKALALVVLAAALAVPAAAAAPATPAAVTLVATVGPGFNISLTVGGKKLTRIKAGTYTIKVADKSDQHDFHLTGPGVDKITSISGKPNLTWRVKLHAEAQTPQCNGALDESS